MNRRGLLAVLLIATCGTCSAQRTRLEQQLMQLERVWSAAYLQHNTDLIERILADDYVGIDGRGMVTSKADEIADAMGPVPGAPPAVFTVLDDTVSDMNVRLYGATAVVNGRTTEKIQPIGRGIQTIQYRRTTVWVKRQGKWQCVSFHGSRILEPTAAASLSEAPTSDMPASAWAEPEGAFFALSVPDANASAAWYEKHLKFRVVSKGEAPGKIARGILLEGHGSLLEIVQHSKARPLSTVLPHGEAYQIHGIFKVGFHIRDIDSAYKTVTAGGAEVVYQLGQAHDMGLRSFTVHDHDGNLVQFFGR